jgi:type III secretion protein O
MSVLRELLSIKAFREDKAEMAVRRQRSLLQDAQDAFDRALRELDAFREWAERRERALFDDLCARTVRLHDIQLVQDMVGEMRGQEHQHVQVRDQAEDQREQEDQALQECKQVHADAAHMKEKFVELVRNHAADALREIERKEDAELEEVTETRRDRADWDEALQEDAP